MSNPQVGERQKDKIYIKVRFYIMSLWVLFILIFALTVNIPVYFGADAVFIGIIPLLIRNILPLISLLMVIIGWFLACSVKYKEKGVMNPPFTIKKINNANYEYLTFLTTVIIPLICIDLSNIRYVIVLCILLVLIGSIFVKMDLYYGNPTLALMGYKIYLAEINELDTDSVVLISRNRLTKDSKIEWIRIDGSVWIAKEHRR